MEVKNVARRCVRGMGEMEERESWTVEEVAAALREVLKGMPKGRRKPPESAYAGKVTEGTKRDLRGIEECAEAVVEIIDEILEHNVPMSVACRVRGIPYIRFRRFCERFVQVLDGGRIAGRLEALNYETSLEEKLYARVFGVSEYEACDLMPDDAEETIASILSGYSDKDRDVLISRMNGKTLHEAGEEYGVSRERARQIEAKMIRKLRATPTMRRLRLGDEAILEAERRHEEERREAMEECERIIRARDEELQRMLRKVATYSDGNYEIYRMEIEALEPSVRLYNVLKRAGISTVGELMSRSRKELMGLRNMGRRTMDELDRKLSSLGLTLEA